jgi:integrase
MQLEINTEGIDFVVSRAPLPKNDNDGRQKTDRETGAPLHVTELVAMDETGAEVIKVTTSGEPRVAKRQLVTVVKLVATPWNIDGRGKCCGAVPSPRTVSDLRTVLRSALSSAAREELITKNVVTMTRLPARRRRKRKPWSSDEARTFLESVRHDDNALYAAYVLILVLGLRKGEVLGLSWNDVDLDMGELAVSKQLQRVRGELLHRETKTEASDATLPLPPICVTALKQRQAVQDRAREAAGEAWTRSDLVFTTRYGDPIEPRNFNRYFTARCAAAGVRQITVHDARRTCATLLVDLDVHPRIVMQILRHAQFDVTMEVYASASSAATQEALKRLGASLDG